MHPVFLTVKDVREIHRDQIDRYGGTAGIREKSLLQSAVAQPRATFDGKYLHDGLYEMASAYLYHLVMNHPFLDGNKRTGAAAALVFLYLNGIQLLLPEDEYTDLVLRVAKGELNKPEITQILRTRQLSAQ